MNGREIATSNCTGTRLSFEHGSWLMKSDVRIRDPLPANTKLSPPHIAFLFDFGVHRCSGDLSGNRVM